MTTYNEQGYRIPQAPMTRTILDHLEDKGSISGVEAIDLYRCRSLPRRIKDLKDMGWPITTDLKTDRTGQRYARYTLETN